MNEKQTDGICLSEAEIKLKKVEQQFRELKSSTGRVRPEQEEWLSKFRDEGGIGSVVRSLDEVIQILP